MTKSEIEKEINEMDVYVPVSKIEEILGMPITTLQKVLKGERKLPKKWGKKLEYYFIRCKTPKTESKIRKMPLQMSEVDVHIKNVTYKEPIPEGLKGIDLAIWKSENKK